MNEQTPLRFIAALAPSLRALKAQSDDICGRVASGHHSVRRRLIAKVDAVPKRPHGESALRCTGSRQGRFQQVSERVNGPKI